MDRGTFMGVDDKVTHSTRAGDVDSGKAWRKLRRPSDMVRDDGVVPVMALLCAALRSI